MPSLSDLPDDILRLISFRLNGFDNCSLWMASGSQLRQRLASNVIVDFDIRYTIPGRYLWPGNFLKRLSKLSRLSLVVDLILSHLPIQNIELFPIPTLKYLKFDFTNTYHVFDQYQSNSSDNPTGPTTSVDNKYINLNDYYSNLEHLEVITPWLDGHFSKDFLGCLPQKLQTLLIPRNYFKLDLENPTNDLNNNIQILPTTLTTINACFEYPFKNPALLDLTKLPPNLTSLTTNANIDQKSYHMMPKSLEKLLLLTNTYSIDKFAPFLPTGLKSLAIPIDENPSSMQSFSRLENLEHIFLQSQMQVKIDDFLPKCPPKLQQFSCNNLVLRNLPVPTRIFSNCLTTLSLTNVAGISSEFVSSLPPSLTDLILSGTGNADEQPIAFFSLLPRNLKSLVTNLNIVENTSLLPESLTILRLNAYKTFDASHFDRLPPKLESLQTLQKLPRLMMKQLPASLTYLYLASDELVDGEILATLPRGLTRLYLETLDNIMDQDIAALPPRLQILLLFENTKLTDDAIALLPRSLVQLNMPKNPNFTDKCIKHLRHSQLTSLCLSQATKITSNSCKDLPEYLEVLSLPNCKDWDPEMLITSKNELPRFLRNITLGNPEATRTWKSILTKNSSYRS